MIDLDWFKSVNDRHGHLVGDRVLHAVATCLQEQVRRRDVVARFGGEEFAVLMPDTIDVEVDRVAERIRCAVEQLEIRIVDPAGDIVIADLSVSIGEAGHPQHGSSVDEVLQAADNALYRAKREGRNRVVRAVDEQAPMSPLDSSRTSD